MLIHLQDSKLLTTTKITLTEWKNELNHRAEFARFLREIPGEFQQYAKHSKKRDLVRDHLKKCYGGLPKEHEVETVLERITNLAAIVSGGKDAVENKAGQIKFKKEHWKTTNRCVYCGHEFMDFSEVTLDHIIPLSLGGAEKEENWTLACRLCNEQKKESWGVADLSRIESLRGFEGNFFKLSAVETIDQLRLPKNPTRYWILARDEYKCSQCGVLGREEKLYVGWIDHAHLLTPDNLSSYCLACAKKIKCRYCE